MEIWIASHIDCKQRYEYLKLNIEKLIYQSSYINIE